LIEDQRPFGRFFNRGLPERRMFDSQMFETRLGLTPAELCTMLGTTLGVALGIMAIATAALWKIKSRQHWLAAISPLALGAGFVAGYAVQLDLPREWNDEAWKMIIVLGGIAGVLLAAAQVMPARGIGRAIAAVILATAVGLITWYTVRKFTPPAGLFWADHARMFRMEWIASLAGWLAAVLLAGQPAMRQPRLWAIAPLIILLCASAGVIIGEGWVDKRIPWTLMILAALAGLSLAAGLVRPSRGHASGAAAFLAVMFGAIWSFITYYNESTIPTWAFAWFGAAPLAMAPAWIPPLQKRPRLCTALCLLAALAILIPAIIVIVKFAPPLEGAADQAM
jgi:hypothetical protein